MLVAQARLANKKRLSRSFTKTQVGSKSTRVLNSCRSAVSVASARLRSPTSLTVAAKLKISPFLFATENGLMVTGKRSPLRRMKVNSKIREPPLIVSRSAAWIRSYSSGGQ